MRIQPNRVLINGLIAGIAMLMVAGVAGAVVKPGAQKVRAGDKSEQATGDKDKGGDAGFVDPTAETVPDGTTATTVPGASGGGEAGGGTGAKSTVAAPGPGAPKPAGTLTAPKPGQYEYQTEGEDPQTLRIANESVAAGETRQAISGDAAFGSGTVHSVWNNQGYLWEKLDASGGGESGNCTFTPPLHMLPGNLAVGTEWKFDSRCSFQAGAQNIELHFYGTGKVTGVDRVSVGGKQADVWVIQRDQKIDVNYGSGNSSNSIKSEERWAPSYGLQVEAKATVETKDGSESKTKRLLNLDPK